MCKSSLARSITNQFQDKQDKEDDVRLDDIRAFVAVVEHGGYRAAAEALFMSQPSLSRRVKRLEESLGVRLLDRGPWGLEVTRHGAAMLRGSRRLFIVADEVRSAAIGAWDETLRLGAASTAAGSYLADFLASWIKQNPEKRVSTVDDGAIRLQNRLSEGECDVAILLGPVPEEFDSLPIRRAQVSAMISPDHSLAQPEGRPLSILDLEGERVLLEGRASASTDLALSACRIAGVSVQVAYECEIWWTLASFAEKGLGIAIVGDNLDTKGMNVCVRPLSGQDGLPLIFDLCIAWSRRRQLAPVAADFAQQLSEYTKPLRLRSARRPL